MKVKKKIECNASRPLMTQEYKELESWNHTVTVVLMTKHL